ncbi:hypothetical protein [Pseudomonas lopnurensis]|uniref:hypothetical protein n=1 Tax=Pseudomonas lopnurensis TaxID=1477517 RepID=UPI0028AD6F25|nr:hypothetical protein [Pseudomonas lopnurensis]
MTPQHDLLVQFLIEAVSQCLERSPTPLAWRVGEHALIHEVYLSGALKIGSPIRFRHDPIDYLLEHGLASRPNRYVLSHTPRYGVLASWKSLVQIDCQIMGAEFAGLMENWVHHEVSPHPFMLWGTPEDMAATRPAVPNWLIGLLLPEGAMQPRPLPPSTTLPDRHVVIATYHEDPSYVRDLVARSTAR